MKKPIILLSSVSYALQPVFLPMDYTQKNTSKQWNQDNTILPKPMPHTKKCSPYVPNANATKISPTETNGATAPSTTTATPLPSMRNLGNAEKNH